MAIEIRTWSPVTHSLWPDRESWHRAIVCAADLGDYCRWDDRVFQPADETLHKTLRSGLMEIALGWPTPKWDRPAIIAAAQALKSAPQRLLVDGDGDGGAPDRAALAADLEELTELVLHKVRGILRGAEIVMIQQNLTI